ncbi:MAG: NUDIX hydrolase [Promethearchaeota archaeon]|nr:MAG: NUDIX hydrolase [Candidatus Lokiarchaeota archaeon]
MTEELQFIYKEEYWYISAFLNTALINAAEKSTEIEMLIKQEFKNLKPENIFRQDLKDDIIDMVNNISLKCQWVPFLKNFPYKDENSERDFNTLGYFQFDVEYYSSDPTKKKNLSPLLIQQVPYIVLNILKEFSKKPENGGIYLDTESPIYVFVTSNKTVPAEVQWTRENIEKYKKIIAYWTVIYSGQWSDYSKALYDRRIRDNLSNRLSELHFIYRNSGFIYMAEQNYERFFESYMREFVLEPTPKMRAVLFVLRSINESLDLLFLKTYSGTFADIKTIEDKIKNLRFLRGLVQTQLSIIYNELDYNRREHYTSVLIHLIKEFDLPNVVSRANEKFDLLYDAMQELYLKKNEENAQKTERRLNLLNLLFGAGILGDLAGIMMIVFSLQENSLPAILLNILIFIVISGILFTTIGYYIYSKFKISRSETGRTVDAVIEDDRGNIVLIKRKYPPFKDFYALPGGFIEKGESPKQAVLREAKEETNLDLVIVKKIGVFDKEGRDPRGKIISTAFKCRIIGDSSKIKGGTDSATAKFFPKEKIKNLDLAFDHRDILKEAGILY